MKEKNLYLESSSFAIGTKQKTVKRKRKNFRKTVDINCQIFRLKQMFTIIFNSDTLLNTARNYMNSFDDNLSDIKDGEKISGVINDSTFPFMIYYDEIETGNPLGSHKGIHKIGVFYVSLRCLPTHLYSKLDYIYPLMLIPSMKSQFLHRALERSVIQVNDVLEAPIDIKGVKLSFRFAGFIGDNLGLHQILRFTEGFTSNFPCRFCTMPRNIAQFSSTVDNSLLRNLENYTDALQILDVSATGITRDSPLKNILNYHVLQNSFVDLMHDFAEGVGNYGMTCIIKYYVTNALLNLEALNDKLSTFHFHQHSNGPPVIK